MTAIITGDIINSRQEPPKDWLPILKEILNHYGRSPREWEIFRGDSFQLQVEPKKAFLAAVHLKSGLKQIRNLDARIAIGIGEQDHQAKNLNQSNGSAFVRSGECFENLKKQNLGISSGDADFDENFNLLFALALLSMDAWSPTVAATIKASVENPETSQTELAKLLEKSQSSLSEALKRGAFEEVLRLDEYYRRQIVKL